MKRIHLFPFILSLLVLLITNCGGGGSSDPRPVADAGPVQFVLPGFEVTLDGSGSLDPEGNLLTYLWSFIAMPAGSTAALSDTTAVDPTFTADLKGIYELSLVVNNGDRNSLADIVTITVNTVPLADAGPDQVVSPDTEVTLDGSGSSDPDGDDLTYLWSFTSVPAGSAATLTDATAVSASFTPDEVGDYVVSLVVNDGTINSAADAVMITVSSIPVADAGPDQGVITGSEVALDGSASSDPNGDDLTYLWSFTAIPAGSTAAISDTNIVDPVFTADLTGTYELSLVVNDGTTDSEADTVIITASATPSADAGPDQGVITGSEVALDGSASSDPDGDDLTYLWSFTAIPGGSTAAISDTNIVDPVFTADLTGTYQLSLVVSDGISDSVADTVTILANATPVANAGPDQGVITGSEVALDGSASSDPDGDDLNYLWSFTAVPAGSTAAISDTNIVNPTFIADLTGTYELSLVVNDGTLNSAADTVTITANAVPLADAGPDQGASTSSLVALDGSGSSDPDGDDLTYLWSFTAIPAGSLAALDDTTIVNPTFTPDEIGDYVVSLVVNDGTISSAADSVTIVVSTLPVADAGPDQGVITGSEVALDGSGSSDPDDDPITYLWSFTTIPGGSTAAISDTNIVNPTFTADLTGIYQLSLVVNDGISDSVADTVTITANAVPLADAGPDQVVLPETEVALDGSGSSDPDDDPITYLWSFTTIPAGSLAALDDTTIVNPTFTPDEVGDYVLSLVVNDGTISSTADTVVITANAVPLANAGPDQDVVTGSEVTLDGSASSDPDGDDLSYLWSFTTIPAGSTAAISDTNIVNPTFTADLRGTYQLSLVVNDGISNSVADTVTIAANAVPVADAGLDQDASVGSEVTLNGSGSSDPDGDDLTYLWTFTTVPDGSTAVLLGETSDGPTFTPDEVGNYVVSLVVNDGDADSAADEVIISATVDLIVSPLYPNYGASWNDYVNINGSDIFDPLNDDPAPTSGTGGYFSVLHGGEMRSVTVTGLSSCADILAYDNLGAFVWTCLDGTDPESDPARVVSTGLADGVFLSDLIDFATAAWQENIVVVEYQGGPYGSTSPDQPWWNNPVNAVVAPGTLNEEGAIYAVSSNLDGELVIDADKVALVTDPGVVIQGATEGANVLSADTQSFLWIEADLEGTTDGSGSDSILNLTSVEFSVLRGVSAYGSGTGSGVALTDSANNLIRDVYAWGNVGALTPGSGTGAGFQLVGSPENLLAHVAAWSNNTDGIWLSGGSNDNRIISARLADNNRHALQMWRAFRNVVNEVVIYNNHSATLGYGGGIVLANESQDNILSNVTSFNNRRGGVYFYEGGNNVLISATAANNGRDDGAQGFGLSVWGSSNNTVTNLTSLNNPRGLNIFDGSSDNRFHDMAVGRYANSLDGWGIYLDTTTNVNLFTGDLLLGNDEYAIADSGTGNDFTGAAITYNNAFADSFNNQVDSDAVNTTSHVLGEVFYEDITDWIGFESGYRGWGKQGSNSTPSLSNRGAVALDDTARLMHIWDWSLDAGDATLLDAFTIYPVTGTLTHTWSDDSTTEFLVHAVEIMNDGVGNDNGLCEPSVGEDCIYTPNVGSYQGHGSLDERASQPVAGVVLYEYSDNGR